MPRVDFYLLQSGSRDSALRLACRLANKVYQADLTGIVRVPDPESAARLDDLLWTYEQGSFVPHNLDDGTMGPQPPPIIISHHSQCDSDRDVLISLIEQIPDDYARYDRIAEVVGTEPREKDKARDRYRFYRDQGCQLQTHELPGQ
jgi:DNA polymerase-3 subunit chi